MAITLAGTIGMNIPYPIEGNEIFWENFLTTLDGGPATYGVTTAITQPVAPGKMFGVYGWNATAGTSFLLPPATGTGWRILFYVSTLATSNSHVLWTSSANGVGGTANVFVGIINGTRVDSGNAVLGFAAASTSNTITLNRTTTGSVSLGEWVQVIDVAAGTWLVSGMLSATGGAFATPFSHT